MSSLLVTCIYRYKVEEDEIARLGKRVTDFSAIFYS